MKEMDFFPQSSDFLNYFSEKFSEIPTFFSAVLQVTIPLIKH